MPPKEEPRSPTLVSSTLDLISEETGHDLEDSDADVIRLAQHRPYLHMQNSISGLQASSNNNNNNNSNYTTTGISLERPTGRRMVLAGVVITSRKRPRSDMSVDDDIAEPSSSSSLPESRSVPPLTKSVAVHSSTRKQKVPRRSYSERQKEILEKAYRKSKNPSAESHKQIAVDIGETVARVQQWFSTRRYKERCSSNNEDVPIGSGSEHSSQSTTPVPSSPPHSSPPQPTSEPVEDAEFNYESSEREDTPSADGVLGSASVRYRPLSVAMPKTAALKKPGKESKRGSGKSASFLERLASSVKGASIVSADQIPAIVDLMALANSPTEKRNVLNAILNTKNTLILRRFMVTDGPNKIRGWVAESKRETGSAEHKELLQKMIATFKKLPYDKQNLPDPKLRSTIRQLAVDKLGHHGTDLVKDTTELTNSWCKLSGETPLGLARSTPAVHSEGSRKKPRLEDILFSNREDLPSFTKAKSVPGKVTIAKDTTPKDTATRDSIAKESAAKNTANKEAASKPQSRIRENADFFKEIGQQSSSSTTYSRDTSTNREGSRPARGAPSPTSSQPGNKNITGIGTNNVGPRTNAPPTIPAAVPFNFRASVPLPSTPIPILRPTPNATPTPITRGPDFNPMSSQHNKAWEAAKKLQQEQLSGRKKTVRFNDSELVQIRIFERFQAELYEDEDDDDDDDEDEMEIQDDYGNGNDEFSPSPPSSPLLSLPLGFGPGFETASHMAPYRSSRPAFIMPENRMLDLMAGMYWTSPRPLHISDQHAPDDSEGEHNEGAYSIEKNVQAKREEGIPAAVYRTIADIPPSPAEPGEEPQGEVDLPRPIQLFNGGADFSSAFVHTMVVVCGYLVNKTPTGHR